MATEEYKVGSYVTVECGEYSDFYVLSVVKVLKPITEEVFKEMADFSLNVVSPKYSTYDTSQALSYLISNGFVEEVETTSMHLGSYGDKPTWRKA